MSTSQPGFGGLLLAGTSCAIAAQGFLTWFDEAHFHARRGLGRWERVGHPLDAFVYAVVLSVPAYAHPSRGWLGTYLLGAVFSTLLVTKDEWVHARACRPAEHWLHAVLFTLHPTVLFCVGLLWIQGEASHLRAALPWMVALMGVHPMWRGYRTASSYRPIVDNDFYESLGERWLDDTRHPIALLRAESSTKVAYADGVLRELGRGARLVDVGCGAGLVANPLAARGYRVIGIDRSPGTLAVARRQGPGSTIAMARFEVGDARALPCGDGSADGVLLFDLVEHVEELDLVLAEASRVVRPRGLVMVHTFNRTWLSALFAIYGLRIITPGGPPHVHVYRLFRRPSELIRHAERVGLNLRQLVGLRPVFDKALARSVIQRRVDPNFSFRIGRSLAAGYIATFERRSSD